MARPATVRAVAKNAGVLPQRTCGSTPAQTWRFFLGVGGSFDAHLDLADDPRLLFVQATPGPSDQPARPVPDADAALVLRAAVAGLKQL